MRICLVSREFAPYFGAGIGTYAASMTRAWMDSGHEVHVLTADHQKLFADAPTLYPGVHFHEADFSFPALGWHAFAYHPIAYAYAVYFTLQRLHAQAPFDYVEFPDYWGEGYFAVRAKRWLGEFQGALFGARLHTPTLECRELNLTTTLNVGDAMLDFQEADALAKCDLLLSPTHSLLEIVQKRVGKNQPGRVVPYPFYVDRAVQELGAFVPAQTAKPEVLYFGRLEGRKGVHLLVDAAVKLLREGLDFQVRLVGRDTLTGPANGSMQAYLNRRIPADLKARFVFEPARPRYELASVIGNAAVCCFPSKWENFPNVCLEAMSVGAAVVGSDAGGMAEIIEHEKSGLLFKSGDVESLAANVRRMLTDEALRARVRKAAPARIRAMCDPKSVVAQTVAAVEWARETPAPKKKAARGKAGASPEVTVLVPYYNLAKYLPETLASIRAQTFTDYEVVLVDDGSTDPESVALADKLADEGAVRLVRKQNGGLSSARNAGLAAARGKYVLPLDADDLIQPTFLEKTLRTLKQEPSLAYATSLVAYFEEDPAHPTGGTTPWGLDRELLTVTNVASTCTALMERALIEKLGGYDEWLTSYEDWDLFCAMAERGMQGAVVPEFLFFYRWRADSLTRTEVSERRTHLHTYLLAKHPKLAADPARAQRLMVSDLAEATRRLIIADRWNLKRMVQSTATLRRVTDHVPEPVRDGVRKLVVKLFPL